MTCAVMRTGITVATGANMYIIIPIDHDVRVYWELDDAVESCGQEEKVWCTTEEKVVTSATVVERLARLVEDRQWEKAEALAKENNIPFSKDLHQTVHNRVESWDSSSCW